jgi:hypothetical protein
MFQRIRKIIKKWVIKRRQQLGIGAHAFNPSTWKARG